MNKLKSFRPFQMNGSKKLSKDRTLNKSAAWCWLILMMTEGLRGKPLGPLPVVALSMKVSPRSS